MDLLPEIVSIAVLVVMFVVATVRGVNMGVLGFIAAAAVGGLVLGMTVDEYLAGFPIDLFVTLLGLTFLFGFAQHNGAIEVVVHAAMRLLGGRTQLAPWLFFLLTAVLIAIGALFAVAIIAPLAMAFARRARLNLLMTGVMVVHGALAGAFSPVSVYGVFIADFLSSNGFESQPLTLFLAPFVANTAFALVVFLVLRRRPGIVDADALDAERGADAPAADAARGAAGAGGAGTGAGATATDVRIRPNGIQALTLVGLVVMVVGVVVLRLDIGILSLCIGAVLGIVRPAHAPVALSKVSWSVLVLITGVLTYIAVLEAAGTVDWVGDGIASIGVPLAATALLFLLAGVVSALASSLGIIGVVLALSLPFLQQGEVALGGFIAGLAFAATIVDISPFSTNGAMLLASTEGAVRERLYRQMLVYAGLMVAIGPAVGWLMVAVPTALGG